MNTITISKTKIKKEKGVVILSLDEYQKLCERAIPTYYLEEKAAKKLDQLVSGGLKEYKEGKTIKASSLKEAFKLYGKKRSKN